MKVKTRPIASFFSRARPLTEEDASNEATGSQTFADAGCFTCDACGVDCGSKKRLAQHKTTVHKNLQHARMKVTQRVSIKSRSGEELQELLDRAEITDILECMVSKVSRKSTGPNPYGSGRAGAPTRARHGTGYKVFMSVKYM